MPAQDWPRGLSLWTVLLEGPGQASSEQYSPSRCLASSLGTARPSLALQRVDGTVRPARRPQWSVAVETSADEAQGAGKAPAEAHGASVCVAGCRALPGCQICG